MKRKLRLLIDKMLHWAMIYPGDRHGMVHQRAPGYLVKKLSDEERELLKEAKPEDFQHWMK